MVLSGFGRGWIWVDLGGDGVPRSAYILYWPKSWNNTRWRGNGFSYLGSPLLMNHAHNKKKHLNHDYTLWRKIKECVPIVNVLKLQKVLKSISKLRFGFRGDGEELDNGDVSNWCFLTEHPTLFNEMDGPECVYKRRLRNTVRCNYHNHANDCVPIVRLVP